MQKKNLSYKFTPHFMIYILWRSPKYKNRVWGIFWRFFLGGGCYIWFIRVLNFFKKMYTMDGFKIQTVTSHQQFSNHITYQLWITEHWLCFSISFISRYSLCWSSNPRGDSCCGFGAWFPRLLYLQTFSDLMILNGSWASAWHIAINHSFFVFF